MLAKVIITNLIKSDKTDKGSCKMVNTISGKFQWKKRDDRGLLKSIFAVTSFVDDPLSALSHLILYFGRFEILEMTHFLQFEKVRVIPGEKKDRVDTMK